jgi:hypothetical protein
MDDHISTEAIQALEDLYGTASNKSAIITFDHTEYYKQEMGSPLYKFLVSFDKPVDAMEIVGIKHQTNKIEEHFSISGKRQVNLDPGYMEAAKLILATTKNFSHRIYLGQGIYGDVQLFWRQGKFTANPWTYPDYLEKTTLDFLTQLRTRYLEQGNQLWA